MARWQSSSGCCCTASRIGPFRARRNLPFQLVIQKLMFLAGGLYAPITLYPSLFETLAKATPFAAQLYWAGAQMLGGATARAWPGVRRASKRIGECPPHAQVASGLYIEATGVNVAPCVHQSSQ